MQITWVDSNSYGQGRPIEKLHKSLGPSQVPWVKQPSLQLPPSQSPAAKNPLANNTQEVRLGSRSWQKPPTTWAEPNLSESETNREERENVAANVSRPLFA